MSELYYLLQRQNSVINIYGQGLDFKIANHQYTINFYSDQENVEFALNRANEYSESEINFSETELIEGIIKLYKEQTQDSNPDLDDYVDLYDLEQYISETLVVDYDDAEFDFEDLLFEIKASISKLELNGVYQTGTLSQLGSVIRLEGINAILDHMKTSPDWQQAWPKHYAELTYLKYCADCAKNTMATLVVNGTDFAKIFCVADKTVVSRWCNAGRKPDNFRLLIMEYISQEKSENIIDFLQSKKYGITSFHV